MDGRQIVLIALLGVVSCSHHEITGSLSEVTVRRGDSVTVYCDCKLSTGVYIVWYRNCSHENQPTLVLKAKPNYLVDFQFLKNFTSNTFDLLIVNVTESDEGLYYCGNEEMMVVDTERIGPKYFQSYGKMTTRILLNSRGDHSGCSSSDGFESWRLVVLAPAVAILSLLLSFILVHHFCQKSDNEPQVQRSRSNRSRRKIHV